MAVYQRSSFDGIELRARSGWWFPTAADSVAANDKHLSNAHLRMPLLLERR